MTDDHQLTRDDLAGMTPEEIVDALEADRFSVMLGGSPEDADLKRRAQDRDLITRTELRRLRDLGKHDLIANLPTTCIRPDQETS